GEVTPAGPVEVARTDAGGGRVELNGGEAGRAGPVDQGAGLVRGGGVEAEALAVQAGHCNAESGRLHGRGCIPARRAAPLPEGACTIRHDTLAPVHADGAPGL